MQTIQFPTKAKVYFTRLTMFLFSLMLSVVAFAQEETKKVDVNISSDSGGGGNFFASPWVWVVGIAVFVLLLVALMRGGSRRSDV
jgi:hypothetical protein